MTLRLRIAGLVAAVVTVVVVVVGVSVHSAAESELIEEVDESLIERSRVAGGPVRPNFRGPGAPFGRNRGDQDEVSSQFERQLAAQTYARVLDDDGSVLVVLGNDFEATTDPDVLGEIDRRPLIQDGMVDGERARVVTVPFFDLGYLQIAEPLAEIERSLAELRSRIYVIGGVAIVLAAAAAWFLAAGTARPIQRLTDAAARVAATGDLDHPVDGSGGDEVGRLASSFNAMLSALAASRSQQRQLVMDASHELRTPLASLRTNVDVLRSGREIPAETREAVLADIDSELGELTELMGELVELAADVREDEEIAPVALAELVAEVAERAQRRTGREIELEVVRPAVVEGRPEALSRAIRNLVDNAAKFSPDDTPIMVIVDGGTVAVDDAGPGIAPDERAAVFERFYRVESTRTLPGSGLGLAIVRQVADAHDGTVFIEDSPAGGARIGFTIRTVDD